MSEKLTAPRDRTVPRYTAGTVIAAQRRVLKLAVTMLEQLPIRERLILRAVDGGVMTLDELTDHCRQASALKRTR